MSYVGKGISHVTRLDEDISTLLAPGAVRGALRVAVSPNTAQLLRNVAPTSKLNPASGKVVNVKSMRGGQIPAETSASIFKRGGLFSGPGGSGKEYIDQALAIRRAQSGLAPMPGQSYAFLYHAQPFKPPMVGGTSNRRVIGARALSIEKSYQSEIVDYGNLPGATTPQGTPRGIGSLMERHHGGELQTIAVVPLNHPSTLNTPEGGLPPTTQYAADTYNAKFGNDPISIMNVPGWQNKRGRLERVKEIYKQLPEGAVHSDTIYNLLRGSKMDLKEIPKDQLRERELFKKEYGLKEPIPSELGELAPDVFMPIPIKDASGKLIETWTPANIDEYQRRFSIVLNEKLGIKQKVDLKKVEVDPDLDIYGTDHMNIHDVFLELRKESGNVLNEIHTLKKLGKIRKLTIPEAGLLQTKAQALQERIAANTLVRRYNKIRELYVDLKAAGELKRFGYNADVFDELNRASKQRFIRRFINKVVVKGGAFKKLTKAQSILPIKEWPEGATDVFGWKPQMHLQYLLDD